MKVGAIAYRKTRRGVEICLVSSRRHAGKMTFPKGVVKRGGSLIAAGKRELYEEAGIRGKVKQKAQPICFHPRARQQDAVLYFLVKVKQVDEAWPESGERQRVFAPLARLHRLPLGDAPKKLCRQLQRLPRFADEPRAVFARTPRFASPAQEWRRGFTGGRWRVQ